MSGAHQMHAVCCTGDFDNLLFYYQLMYDQIQTHYASNTDRKFTSKHYSDYIRQPKPAGAADSAAATASSATKLDSAPSAPGSSKQ
jgi:hypothetical protein